MIPILPAFFEIKRRLNNIIVKDRVCVKHCDYCTRPARIVDAVRIQSGGPADNTAISTLCEHD
jgi:hypothetical protein